MVRSQGQGATELTSEYTSEMPLCVLDLLCCFLSIDTAGEVSAPIISYASKICCLVPYFHHRYSHIELRVLASAVAEVYR